MEINGRSTVKTVLSDPEASEWLKGALRLALELGCEPSAVRDDAYTLANLLVRYVPVGDSLPSSSGPGRALLRAPARTPQAQRRDMATNKIKVVISARALTQRINRALKSDWETLKATRSNNPVRLQLGDYYIVNSRKKAVTRTHVDIEKTARSSGVLKEWGR